MSAPPSAIRDESRGYGNLRTLRNAQQIAKESLSPVSPKHDKARLLRGGPDIRPKPGKIEPGSSILPQSRPFRKSPFSCNGRPVSGAWRTFGAGLSSAQDTRVMPTPNPGPWPGENSRDEATP
jgi:hypothetical protein